MARTFKLKRGLKKDLPILSEGEPGFTLDEGKLYIGDGVKNVVIGSQEEVASHTNNKNNPHGVTASQVQAIPSSQKGAAGGVAELGTDGKIPSNRLPSMDYDPKGSASAVQNNLNTHAADTGLHVTAAKQTNWDNKAPAAHASSATTYGAATSGTYGHVKLSDSISSTSAASAGIAATPKAVKDVNDKITGLNTNLSGKAPTSHASTATTYGAATSENYGHVKLSDAINSTSGVAAGVAATPAAVRTAYNLANTANSTARGKATARTYTARVPSTGWSGGVQPRYMEVAVSGINASMTPIVGLILSDNLGVARNEIKAWACVDRVETRQDAIRVYCYNGTPSPATAMNIQIKVVE